MIFNTMKLSGILRTNTGLLSLVQRMCQSVGQLGEKSEHAGGKDPKRRKIFLKAGQPTHKTHPHLVENGEITSKISMKEYSDRRSNLMKSLIATDKKHHVVLLASTPKRYMIDKIPYLYRQDTDLLYLSGCLEADCVLLMHTLIDAPSCYKTVMFTPQYDPSQELWDGPRTTHAGASELWGVDEGLPLTELTKYLASLELDLQSPCLWYHYIKPANNEIHRLIHPWLIGDRRGKIESAKPFIHDIRLTKSPAEIDLMRQTCKITGESILATMKSCNTLGTSEHELFATVDYQCRMRGAEHLAYPPVVAGGNRANIIHYINNNQLIQPGELILMDAGSEYRGYSGDVTRTWPLNGKFSPAQRELYEAVLEVQQAVLRACAQHPTLDHLFSVMCLKLGQVLQQLSILPSSYNDSQLMRAAYGFCPHHVSHYLGMDVHDTPLVKKNKCIPENSIITVEPGIYINEKNNSVPSRYRGIGIRIEDDVLITKDSYEVLTSFCPRDVDAIEKVVGIDYKVIT